jgi:hypothetical protein
LQIFLLASVFASVTLLITNTLYFWQYELYLWLQIVDTFTSVFYIFLNILTGVIYVIWIFKVHKDLKEIDTAYPVSPWGAMFRIWIPFYSVFYGLWNIYSSMYRYFMKQDDTVSLGVRLIRYVPFYYALFIITNTLNRIFFNQENAISFLGETYEEFFILSFGLDVLLFLIYLQIFKIVTRALHLLTLHKEPQQDFVDLNAEKVCEMKKLDA